MKIQEHTHIRSEVEEVVFDTLREEPELAMKLRNSNNEVIKAKMSKKDWRKFFRAALVALDEDDK